MLQFPFWDIGRKFFVKSVIISVGLQNSICKALLNITINRRRFLYLNLQKLSAVAISHIESSKIEELDGNDRSISFLPWVSRSSNNP